MIAILRRAGEAAQPLAERIAAEVAESEVISGDETSVRVKARNYKKAKESPLLIAGG